MVRAGGITGLNRLYEEPEGRDEDRVLSVMVDGTVLLASRGGLQK